jgi:hypothetical protein
MGTAVAPALRMAKYVIPHSGMLFRE